MKKIAIYGAGGFGKETLMLLREINLLSMEWDIAGFYDDTVPVGTIIMGIPVLGGLDALNTVTEGLHIVLAIGNTRARKTLAQSITNDKVHFATLVHPSVNIHDFQEIQIGHGSIITSGNILTTGINIGEHVIINLACTIGHDVNVSDYCSVMPGCHISGNVKMEEGVYLGTGAVIINDIKLGAFSTVGAGAVVIGNIPANTTAVGIPAREK